MTPHRSGEGSQEHRLSPTMASFRGLVLAFVKSYIAEHSISPSYGEIAAATGGSRTRVMKAVRQLARNQELYRIPGPRGLRLPSQAEEALRLLRERGYRVDEEARAIAPPQGDPITPVTNPPLLPPAELTYPARTSPRRPG